jgi:methyl-accepting chemotaxis protein
MLKRLSIARKLIIGFLGIAMTCLVMGAVSIALVGGIFRGIEALYKEQYPIFSAGAALERAILEEAAHLGACLAGEGAARQGVTEAIGRGFALLDELSALRLSAEQREAVAQLRRQQERFQVSAAALMDDWAAGEAALRESDDGMAHLSGVRDALLARMRELGMPLEHFDDVWLELIAAYHYIVARGRGGARAEFDEAKHRVQTWRDYPRIKEAHEQLVQAIEAAFVAYGSYPALQERVREGLERCWGIATEMRQQIRQFETQADASFRGAIAQMRRAGIRTIWIMAVGGLMILLPGLFLGLRIARGIIPRRLETLALCMERVGEGDLAVEVPCTEDGDEIGSLARMLRQMVQHLTQQVRDVREGVDILTSSVSEISASLTQLTEQASQTASAVAETGATVEQVKQTSMLSNTKAKQVAETAQRMLETSQNGAEAAERAQQEIDQARRQMELIAESIVKLSEQGQMIREIIASVDDLAEQSNLLAVNAAVEAAKAGEQGRGFAVVAQEIKNLAEQSKRATARVRAILGEIQGATSAAVMATEQGTKAVERGVTEATKAGEAVRELTRSISQAAQAARQIAASSMQQFAGVDQVTAAMESIKDASSMTADSCRQLEGSAMHLRELGERLRQIAERYRLREEAA